MSIAPCSQEDCQEEGGLYGNGKVYCSVHWPLEAHSVNCQCEYHLKDRDQLKTPSRV